MGVDTRKGKKGGGSTPQPGTSTPQPAKASKTSTPQQVNTTKSIPPTPSNPQFEECGTCTKAGLKPDESIKCALCLTTHHLMCIDVCKSQLLTFIDMKKCGFKWFCAPCRPMVEKLNTAENTESASYTKTEALCNSMNLEINNIKSKMEEIQEKINTNFDSLKQSLSSSKTPSWADIVSDAENENKPDFVLKMAKEVTDTHKKLSMDRENREKNVIIFNVSEENKTENPDQNQKENNKSSNVNEDDKTENPDQNPEENNESSNEKEEKNDNPDQNQDTNSKPSNYDVSFFEKLCKDTLKLDEIPNVKLFRLGAKEKDKARPIKVIFSELWDKRKFLSRLSYLKTKSKHDIRVAHDMSLEDRLTNQKLLKEAYQKNLKETPTDFRYKVRGPPWNMKIVKVLSKN